MSGERDLVIASKLNLNRLKFSFGSASNANDLASTRRCEDDAFAFFVIEQRLAKFDSVAFLDQHRRSHSDIIVADDGNFFDRRALLNVLNWTACNRQVQSLFLY